MGCVGQSSWLRRSEVLSPIREHDRCEQEWKKELERLKVEDKKRKRKQQYEKKKFTRYQERSRALRDATGVHGFVSLHRRGYMAQMSHGVLRCRRRPRCIACSGSTIGSWSADTPSSPVPPEDHTEPLWCRAGERG